MIYWLIEYETDNGCRFEKHAVVVRASSSSKAVEYMKQNINEYLGYDETIDEILDVVPIDRDMVCIY